METIKNYSLSNVVKVRDVGGLCNTLDTSFGGQGAQKQMEVSGVKGRILIKEEGKR